MTDSLALARGREVLTQLRSAAGRNGWMLLPSVVLLALAAACGVWVPVVLGGLVDQIATSTASVPMVAGAAVAMVLAVAGEALFGAAGFVLTARLFTLVLTRLRDRTMAASYQIPRTRLEQVGSGDLVTRTGEDVQSVTQAVGTVTPALTSALFAIVASFATMVALNPWFGLTALAVVPVHVFALVRYLRVAPDAYLEERAAGSRRSQEALETFSALPTLRAFRATTGRVDRIQDAAWSLALRSLWTQRIQNVFFARLNAAELVGMLAVLVIGFVLVDRNAASVGDVTAAMLLFFRLFGPIGSLLFVIDKLQSALASLSRIAGVSVEAARFSTRSTPHAPVQGSVASLAGVSFAYTPGRQVLSDVDLTIEKDRVTALVGASGSGKSTLAALLAGALEPDSGAISRPRHAVLLTQETHVFVGSLRDNLQLTCPAATDAMLMRTLEDLGATSMLSDLPHGLDSVIGAGYLDLSPVNAQLLSLARVALADPELVILDEPTAEAGSAFAGILDAATHAVLRGRGALVVTHRLAQAEAADIVLVLVDGEIVERGTPAELRQAQGHYARLHPHRDR